VSHFHQCDTPRCPFPDTPGTVAALLHAEERAAFRPLLVDLVAFADGEHEYRDGGCHPQPGVDCYDWCDACKLIARVPADVLASARRQLRERGVER
jgi:hypothetical protein